MWFHFDIIKSMHFLCFWRCFDIKDVCTQSRIDIMNSIVDILRISKSPNGLPHPSLQCCNNTNTISKFEKQLLFENSNVNVNMTSDPRFFMQLLFQSSVTVGNKLYLQSREVKTGLLLYFTFTSRRFVTDRLVFAVLYIWHSAWSPKHI